MVLFRYILRQHIGPFIFSISLIAFIFTMNLMFQLLRKIAGKGIEPLVLIEYFGLNLAWILAMAVPMSVLIATLSVYGRLSEDGEITAMRASGLSAFYLIRPAIIGALIVTIGIGLFNNYILPEMNHHAKLLLMDMNRKKPTLNMEPGVYTFNIPNLVMLAGEVAQEEGRLVNVTIYDERIQGNRSVITAKRGRIQFVPEQEAFYLTLLDGEIHRPSDREPDGWEWTQFDSSLFRFGAPGMVMQRHEEGHRGDRELTAEEMMTRVRELQADERQNEHTLKRISSYMVEIHKKFSIPAACIVFALIGAPLGMLAHKGGMGVSGGMSLLFFTVYWAFLVNGEDLADRGMLSPEVATWSPNVLFFVAGIYLLWLAGRRTTLPFVGWIASLISRLKRK